jgi:LysM repeat protein
MTQIKINKSDFIADVTSGMTRAELKTKYGVPVSVINDWAKTLNLTITIKKAPKYVLIDDATPVAVSDEVTANGY